MNSLIEEWQYLLAPVIATVCAQSIKYYRSLKGDGLQVNDIWATGGMPSTHSAAMAAVVASLAFNNHFREPIFAFALVMLGIVGRDAIGVRRTAGEVAQILKDHPNIKGKRALHIDLGHTPKQVIIGAIFGSFIAGFVHIFTKI